MYLGSRRKTPRSWFMRDAMGASAPVESPPIYAPRPDVTTEVMHPIYMMPPTDAPPSGGGLRLTLTGPSGTQVYEPSQVAGYVVMGFAGWCLYTGVRDLFRMFKGGGS